MPVRVADRRDNGQELVEYALIFPVLMLLILGILELSIIVFSYNTIANAAREGARYGIIHPEDSAGIEAAARARALALDQAALQVAATHSERTVEVEATYDVQLITGLIINALGGNPTIALRTTTTMYREQ